MTTAAETFATWALSLRPDDVPPAARAAARRHILDGLGCALAAVRTEAALYATVIAGGFTAPAEAGVIGSALRAPAPSAALANGMLIHALDFDDTHADALVHVTAAVLPAALAVGEEREASGAEVLAAFIAGAEVVCRLGAAVRHGFHARGFHATSVCGVFAAALVAARLMGLDVATTVHALGIAGSSAAGSLEFLNTGSATKQLHPGLSAQAGIQAARLAAAGATGPATIFEGEYGLFSAYTREAVDAAALTAGLGERWEVERITIKPYPACQLSHASLDALAGMDLPPPERIERITFHLPKDAIDIVAEPAATKVAPRTPYDAKFSLPYCAAALITDGRLDLGSFDPAQIERADVLVLARRVETRAASSGLAVAVAAADAPGSVDITLTDGTTRIGRVQTSRGGPVNPLSDDEVRSKFVANAARDDAGDLADAIVSLDELAAIGDLTARLA